MADNQVMMVMKEDETLKGELSSQGQEDAAIKAKALMDDAALKDELLHLKDENGSLQIHVASLDSRLNQLQSMIKE